MDEVSWDGGPRVQVSPAGRGEPLPYGRWPTAWTVENKSETPVAIEEGWLPHGRYRAERVRYDPPLELSAASSVRLAFDVRWHEEPGTEVENAFVILFVQWHGEPWRIFTRLTVRGDEAGAPIPRTELITAQRVESSV